MHAPSLPSEARSALRRASGAALALVAGLAACSDDAVVTDGDDPPACTLAYLGDEAAAPIVELVYLGADDVDHPVAEGGAIDLIFPPQGGRVVFAGVRVTNLDPCAAKLTGALRDLETNQVRFDTRSVNLLPDAEGWGKSTTGDLATYANVPMCPNQWTDQDVFGGTFRLEVTVTDVAGKEGMAQATVTPRCAQPENEAECRCICQGGYVLGQACGEGGGGIGGAGGGGP